MGPRAAPPPKTRNQAGVEGWPGGQTEIDARQSVLLCNLLGPQMLLDGDGEVRASLNGGIVGDDHALHPERVHGVVPGPREGQPPS